MQVHLDREAIGQYRIHGTIQASHEIGIQSVFAQRLLLERRGIDAQAHVVKAEVGNERNVLRCGFGIGVTRRIVACRLGKPVRDVDAPLQVLRAGKSCLLFGGTILSAAECCTKQDWNKEEYKVAEINTHNCNPRRLNV